MKKWLVPYIITTALLAACAAEEPQNTFVEQPQQQIPAPTQKIDTVAENLHAPWAISKIEDTFFITERTGNIVKITGDEIVTQQVELKQQRSTASEAGLLGLVLAPDFAQSNEAYAYYTYENGGEQFNRIVVLQLDGDVWKETALLLDEIPSGTYHHGGRLQIGPDGKLYATTGDASNRDIAQDVNSLGGKILRLNLDGSIPTDNPFDNSYVYSYGHRNPQGITWAPDGTMYASEHGNSANDEINRIEAGQNYGWPMIEGNETQDGLVSPLFTSGNDTTWAPSGMGYYNNILYVAALRGTALLQFNLATNDMREVVTDLGRIRDVLIEGDTLYFISNNSDGRGNPLENDDKLYRIKLK